MKSKFAQQGNKPENKPSDSKKDDSDSCDEADEVEDMIAE